MAALPSLTPPPSATSTPLVTRPPATDFPTSTPLATIPPLPSLTSLPTFTPTITKEAIGGGEVGKVQGSGGLSCQVVKQIPEDWKKVQPGTIVNVLWQIKNTGSSAWVPGEVQFRYIDGEKMYANTSSLALPSTVNPGETGDFLLSVKAPKETDYYSMSWGLSKGSGAFCVFKIQITVKK